MTNRTLLKFSGILIVIAILINMLGFHIYADSTYKEYKSTDACVQYGISQSRYYVFNATGDIRFIKDRYGATYLVSIQNNIKYMFTNSSNNYPLSCATPTTPLYRQGSYNGVSYYAEKLSSTYNNGWQADIPQNENVLNWETAYRYTYGDLAENTPTYGELEISYQQNIITDGNGALNEDIIRWNAYRDTAGNDLQGKNIEIQAIAGYFHGSSYADLKANNFTDWLNATHPAVTMYKGSIEKSYEVYEWGEVATNFRDINTLGMWFWNIFTSEETWYQYGWRYQARLLDEELNPLTEWQLIYTGNSWTPSATETFTDDEPLKPDDVETINDINDENGTTVNWYINNTYVTNNEYNQQYQQNIIENIYNILQGQPDDGINQKAHDIQQTVDNAIDTEDNYLNDLDTKLNNLELNDITENNGLMGALRWVREVHKETIEQTEFGGIVLTVMLIGLITYLIGRRNG